MAEMRLVVAGAVVLTLAVSTYLLWRVGGWTMDRLVYENKAFSLGEIDLQTDGVIAMEQLRRWASVKSGQNLLALDLARVKRNLELVPFVQSVSVERILPHTLRIRVCEREPVAQILVSRSRIGGGLEQAIYHLDSDGWAMVPLDPRQRAVPQSQVPEQLPMISGIKEAQDDIDVFRLDRLILFQTRRHVIQHIEGTQNDLVFLDEKICAFHETLLPRFLNASINPR